MGWVVQIIAVASVLASQTPATVSHLQSLPPAPSQTMVTCRDATWEAANLTNIGGARVHKKLAPFVEKLIAEAKKQSIPMSINVAYRSCDYQLQLRANNCGLGDYNLYQKPSEQCSPPTEPAGHSLHNEGLAIDFSCSGYGLFESSPCLAWLRQNAESYHLYNHATEAWHWSTTGK